MVFTAGRVGFPQRDSYLLEARKSAFLRHNYPDGETQAQGSQQQAAPAGAGADGNFPQT